MSRPSAPLIPSSDRRTAGFVSTGIMVRFLASAAIFATAGAIPMANCPSDARAPWEHVGPAAYGDDSPFGQAVGAIQAMARGGGSSTDERWFAASANGGIWASTDSLGTQMHWEQVLDNQPVNCYSMSALSVSQYNKDIILAGCGGSTSSEQGSDWTVMNDGEWGGVMMSTDGGQNWAMTSFPQNYYITGIIALDDNTLVVSARAHVFDREDGGVWVGIPTQAGGAYVWQRTLTTPVFDLRHLKGTSVIIAASPLQKSASVSFNRGGIWEPWSNGLRWGGNQTVFYSTLAVGKDKIYLGGYAKSNNDPTKTKSQMFQRAMPNQSTPGGADNATGWEKFSNNKGLDDDAMPKDRMGIVADPDDKHMLYVVGNGDNIGYRINTRNGNFNWTSLADEDTKDASEPHADCRSVFFDKPGNQIVVTTDGGIYARTKPDQPGGKWRSFNGDIKGMEFLSANWDATANRWIGGAQDNDVQVAPPNTTSDNKAWGVVFGDGTVTAVDNTVSPARLWGARQCLGVGPDDQALPPKKGGGDNSADSDDETDDAGLAVVWGGGKKPKRMGIDLSKMGFGAPECFPFFVSPYALDSQDPQNMMFWVNCETNGNRPGFYKLRVKHSVSNSSNLPDPEFVAETDGQVYSFVAGGRTKGKSDPSVLVGMNDTHLFHQSDAGNETNIKVRQLPTTFAQPVIFEIRDNQTVIGPISHDKTVSIAVSARDSDLVAVTGWPKVEDNSGNEGVWVSFNAGSQWVDVTGDLTQDATRVRPSGLLIVDFELENALNASALLVGTTSGVFVSWTDKSGQWTRLGSCEDMPLIMVKGLSYEHFSDTLVAASMGRGIYVIRDAKNTILQTRNDGSRERHQPEADGGTSAKYFAPRNWH